jgi:gamma-glutamyltranspeptidase
MIIYNDCRLSRGHSKVYAAAPPPDRTDHRDPRPGRLNSVGPHKRPLNIVCPTIIRRRIVNVAAHLCRQIVEHGATGLQAVTAPRLHVEEQDPIEVTRNLKPELVAELQSLGHEVRIVNAVGGTANVCERLHNNALRGASNIRAVGVNQSA